MPKRRILSSSKRVLRDATKRGRKRRATSTEYDVWSIGIYTGVSPLRLYPSRKTSNPVLAPADVSDVPAAFVADPFMLRSNGSWYMFFEVMNSSSDKGEIGLAESHDGYSWVYRQIVLDEPFHLSYPYVFEWGGKYYMVPETLAQAAVSLYVADPFPTTWRFVRKLIDRECADPSVFYYKKRWWLFACTRPEQHDTLALYFADELFGPWVEHPCSPVVENDERTARPGGRVLVVDGRVIRFTQDCYPMYGSRVRAFEISELSPTRYSEREITQRPILKGSGKGWNRSGMHTVDSHMLQDGRWIACVDGVVCQ
jgi:hypothetical protein